MSICQASLTPTSDQIHDLGYIVRAAPLVYNGERCVVQLLGESAGAGDAADVGRYHNQVARWDPLAGQVVEDDRLTLRPWRINSDTGQCRLYQQIMQDI